MKAIEFVVRDSAGALQRGVVSDEASTHVIQARTGQEISLNLRQTDLQGQVRSGDDLVITLADGRVITIDGYFNDAGNPNRLFISSEGYLNEVALEDIGSGKLHAQFGPTQEWGKWSATDDLFYLGRTEVAAAGAQDEEVSMFAAPLLGSGLLSSGAGVAAAVVGGAAVIGGVGGGADGGPVSGGPYVDDGGTETRFGGDDRGEDVITVTGGGDPGDTVVVTIGDKTVDGEIDDTGNFKAVFSGVDFPVDGQYETAVVVTTGSGDVTLDGPNYTIDTTAPDISVTSGTGSVMDFFNAETLEEGVSISGIGEPGATVRAIIADIEQTTTVDANGDWTVRWEQGAIDGGEYTTDVTIQTSDSVGNTATITDTLVVDTISEITIDSSTVETDGIVNEAEREDGVTLTGTAQVGSNVEVTFGTGTHTATVDADGNWSADFGMSEVPTGEISATVTAVATDTFGNSATTTEQVDIDTLVSDFGFTGSTGGEDGVINIAEAAVGFTMTGTTEAGSSVSVTLNGVTHQAVVGTDGIWTVDFSAGDIPTGEQTVVMSATATDAAGNMDTITQDVVVDRDAGVLTLASPVEGDNVVNAVEASDGVALVGTSNPGATVTVTMAGVSHSVTTDAAGNWGATFLASEVAAGDYTADIHAVTVDAAGNPLETTGSLQIDTRVDNLSIDVGAVGGADGVINGMERLADGGVTISGTTEVGSALVVVTLNGVDANATVDAAGNWTAQYTAEQIAEGTYDVAATVTATDAAGNVASVSGIVMVDTEVVPFALAGGSGGADNVVNAVEAATGIDLGGQVEAGSTVTVIFDETEYAAQVDVAGNWSLTIPPSDIRPGSYAAAISVSATDVAGNVDMLSDTLAIDTDAPEGPVIASYTRDGDGIRGISTEISADDLAAYQVTDSGVSEVNGIQTDIDVLSETRFDFSPEVPDGSHLVITATDDAGNLGGTYVVLDDEAAATQVTLDGAALGDYNIETLDLNFAEEGNLTITEETLLALSGNSNELQINGGADDKITVKGAVAAGSEMRDGQSYDIYTLGDEGKLMIDDNITVVT